MKKIKIIVFIFVFILIFNIWNSVLKINRDMSSETDKSKQVDYVLLGSSHMYYGVNPLEIWNKTGYTGINLGTDLQLPETSYFYLKKYLEKGNIPKVVFLDFYGFTLIDGNASFNLETMSRFPLSQDKISYIQSIRKDERLNLIFPFLQFHSRWSDLNKTDLSLEKNNSTFSFMGYVPKNQVFYVDPSEYYPQGNMSANYIPTEEILDDFSDIYNLCSEYGIELVLITVPTTEWTKIIFENVNKHFAQAYNIDYIDFNDIHKEIGFDSSKDFQDAFHLNNDGSKKVSGYLADYMKESFDFEDKRSGSEAVFWNEKYNEYVHYLEILEADTSSFTSENYLILKTEIEDNQVNVSATRNGVEVFEDSDENTAISQFEFSDKKFYLEATNIVGKTGSKIQVDYQNYSKNQGKTNIVVYDLIFDTVVSVNSF